MTTSYFINKCLSIAIGLKTPQETWYNELSNYFNLRVCGRTT